MQTDPTGKAKAPRLIRQESPRNRPLDRIVAIQWIRRMSNSSSVVVQECLDRLRAGDASAREGLLEVAGVRLRKLAVHMMSGAERLQRWEQPEDLLQNSLLRLHRTLAEVHPATVREFFQFATLQFRRELVDLARHYFGAEGLGANHASADGRSTESGPIARAASDESSDADELAMWTELHDQIKSLPDESRETFELLFYHGLTQNEVANLLDVSTRTIQRRWTDACELLRRSKSGSFLG